MDFISRLRRYRPLLWGMAVIGFFGLNGVFLYFYLLHPDVMADALQNPISVVFMLEAFLMTAFVAWLIWLSELRRPGWISFIVLSLIGSLAFSVPAWLLLQLRKRDNGQSGTPAS
jgi:drug/metabolite transporter (DMT)-like permease